MAGGSKAAELLGVVGTDESTSPLAVDEVLGEAARRRGGERCPLHTELSFLLPRRPPGPRRTSRARRETARLMPRLALLRRRDYGTQGCRFVFFFSRHIFNLFSLNGGRSVCQHPKIFSHLFYHIYTVHCHLSCSSIDL